MGWVFMFSLLSVLLPRSSAEAQRDPWRTVRLHVAADADEPVALFVPTPGGGRSHFELLCEAPCDVDVFPARFRFGVERPGHRARRMSNVLDVQESQTLRVLYEDRSDTRVSGGLLLGLGVIGWATAIGGLVASIGDAISATFGGMPATNGPLAFIIAGTTLGTICVPVGLVLAFLKDVAEVRIDPDGALRF